ncbi:MAG TPA: sulfatase-like hydrolase/transferase [Candidatus Brocadiia bacterium]|nr:sulfatase-like hydrolase/transferase [Candidatus Brocadiia bacterium]
MAKSGQPNVLVVFTDQQRWDTCGCYNSPMELTPNLDRMASRGVLFENAFTCQPVCAPARASLQTGLYAKATGVWRNDLALRPDQPTLGTWFSNAGYDVGYVGKWHLACTSVEPVPRELRCGYNGFWEVADILEFTSHPYAGHVFDANNRIIEFKDMYRVDFITDRAIRFMDMERNAPFFLFISYIEPHQQNDWNKFCGPEGYEQRYANPWIPQDLRYLPGDWVSQLPGYYGCIRRIDECLGRMLNHLEESGRLEDTVVIFTSDHGCHFRTRNSEYKRSCHESCIRIPMVAAGPGFERQRVERELVSLIDLPPTLLDSAGIPVPKEFHGRSLLPLARGEAKDWPEEVFLQISERTVERCVRTKRWKYSVFAPEKHGWHDPDSKEYVERYLYDLYADPHEMVNLAGRPGRYREVADDLMERLKERMTQAGEDLPVIHPARHYA